MRKRYKIFHLQAATKMIAVLLIDIIANDTCLVDLNLVCIYPLSGSALIMWFTWYNSYPLTSRRVSLTYWYLCWYSPWAICTGIINQVDHVTVGSPPRVDDPARAQSHAALFFILRSGSGAKWSGEAPTPSLMCLLTYSVEHQFGCPSARRCG